MNARPIIVHGCHCRVCQRMTGSAFAVNVMVESDKISFLSDGRPESIHTPSALPAGQIFMRCPRCFCAVWSHHSGLGEAIALINAGSFDAAEAFAPDVHCHTATKHPWIALPPDKPQFIADYDVEAVWSGAVRLRIERAMAGLISEGMR